MKKNKMRRLLGLAKAEMEEGWALMSDADSLLILGNEPDEVVEEKAGKLVREAKGKFAGVVSLLEEIANDDGL